MQAFDADLADLADGTLSNAAISLNGTDASKLASGTTPQRPVSPVEGQIRYNTTEKVMEYYKGADGTNPANWYFMVPKVAFLYEELSNGSHAGSFTIIGDWVTRVLNKQQGDNFVSLNPNKFTLPSGQYIIEASAPALGVTNHKIRLKNFEDNIFYYGGSAYTNNPTYAQTNSQLFTIISISDPRSFEIQHKCKFDRLLDGLGSGALKVRIKIK